MKKQMPQKCPEAPPPPPPPTLIDALAIVSPLPSIMEDQIKDFDDLGISTVKLRFD